MNAIRCPRCGLHERMYQVPLGKVVRNPYATPGRTPVYDECCACNGTGFIPDIIIDAIRNFARNLDRADEYIRLLRWSTDHWSFYAHGTYIGIERDGFVHS